MTSNHFLVPPRETPRLNIPKSSVTITVSIIDSTAHVDLPINVFLLPEIKGKTRLVGPAISFLIQHHSGQKLLFDLGVRKDWNNLTPSIVNRITKNSWKVHVDKNVAEILEDNGVSLDSINAIILSHHHWDHIGDVSTFPSSTDLVVGPGFKEALLPAYPTNPDSPISEAYWKDRNFREISFSEQKGELKIGRFNAFDYFGDGSFYLLDTPGHAPGHMAGLARVTNNPDTFVFMGGDCCHHGGEFRPTEYLPLPTTIEPNPMPERHSVCPGSLLQRVHPKRKADEPFYEIAPDFPKDIEQATWTVRGCEEFDANDDVLVAMAHDQSLLGILGFFPQTLNAWKEKKYKEIARWRFLRDFADAVEDIDLQSSPFIPGYSTVQDESFRHL
ncbi:Metallo-hydrolase/oxidoreductase [Patellaria atrata CBS 101060]|uniref:Metallo-hydrolase/oxidoreductase n=1 Tax=Patellaria atrata CBS 101060 TaxID=1346257 RepID=A0A9P4SJ98_9PEZI|nr:Metallo-hydrolase/oxidoreductase [Patellaria atrata CBS 101060]